MVGQCISIVHRFTNQKVIVPREYYKSWDIERLVIENSWSERTAVLSSDVLGARRFHIRFENHCVVCIADDIPAVEAVHAKGGEMIEDS